MKKLNNKGFTLVELLTVIVILITILTIAIPSITASLSRSEDKQLEAKKQSIAASALIKIKKSDFNSGEYNKFKNGECFISVSKLIDRNYINKEDTLDKNKNTIEGCIGYELGDLKFFDNDDTENKCIKGCELK